MESEGITLDWMFRYSLINDIVKVSVSPSSPLNLRGRRKEKDVVLVLMFLVKEH